MELRLKELRKKAGYTQKQLAEALGADLKTVGNWERGKTIMSIEQIWNCALLLDCSPNDICGWPSEKKSHGFEDDNQKSLNDSYESMNDDGKAMLVSVARSMDKDPMNHRVSHLIDKSTGEEITQPEGDEDA